MDNQLTYPEYRPGHAQVLACNPVRSPFARLFVFDVADPSTPSLVNVADIPSTDAAGGVECRGMAFAPDGSLWTTPSGGLTRLTLDANGIPDPVNWQTWSPPGIPIAVAFEPVTERLFYAAVNSNFVGIVETADPGTLVAQITDVCDDVNVSPLEVEFSPDGDLFVGCFALSTTDVVAIPQAELVGLSGIHTASSINARNANDDADGASLFAFVTTFVPPSDLIRALLAKVEAFELKHGIEQALRASLEAALASVENDRPAAIQQMEAFINKVGAFEGTHATDPQAVEMIADAEEIITVLLSLG